MEISEVEGSHSRSTSFSFSHTHLLTYTPFSPFRTPIAWSKCSREKQESFFFFLMQLHFQDFINFTAVLKVSCVKNASLRACICITAASQTENGIQIFKNSPGSHTILKSIRKLLIWWNLVNSNSCDWKKDFLCKIGKKRTSDCHTNWSGLFQQPLVKIRLLCKWCYFTPFFLHIYPFKMQQQWPHIINRLLKTIPQRK